MTRQAKTPQQRAQEALDVAERHVDRLSRKRNDLKAALAVVTNELDEAVVRFNYLKQHPDLGQKAGSTTPSTTSTGDNA